MQQAAALLTQFTAGKGFADYDRSAASTPASPRATASTPTPRLRPGSRNDWSSAERDGMLPVNGPLARQPQPPSDAWNLGARTSGIASSPARASFTVRGSKASDKPPVRAGLQNAASAAAPPSIAAGKQTIEWFVGSLAETQRCTIRQTPGNPRPPVLLTDVRLAQMSR
jgi:hypothetical protein